jgi:hypothetical protein
VIFSWQVKTCLTRDWTEGRISDLAFQSIVGKQTATKWQCICSQQPARIYDVESGPIIGSMPSSDQSSGSAMML